MTAVACADVVCKLLDLFECAYSLKIGKNCFSCLHSCHSCVFSAVKHLGLVFCKLTLCLQLVVFGDVLSTRHMTVVSKAAHDRKLAALTNLKVVGVMGGSNLNNACSFFHICVFVAYNRDFLVEQRENYVTAVQMLVAFVVLVDCNGCVAEHCFGTCCCNFKVFACFLNLIEQMPEMTVLFLVFNLGIGN